MAGNLFCGGFFLWKAPKKEAKKGLGEQGYSPERATFFIK